MGTRLDTHENYQNHKEDPLVALLVDYLRKTELKKIPRVWQNFIKTSTQDTDLVILISQIRSWGLSGEPDIELRGEELLNSLLNGALYQYVKDADYFFRTKRTDSWPLALEKILLNAEELPTETKIKAMQNSTLNTSLKLSYKETGTLRYEIARVIPQAPVAIPIDWIMEHCGPEKSNATIISNFRNGLDSAFTLRKLKGFELRNAIRKLLTYCTPRMFDTQQLTSDMKTAFPHSSSFKAREGEPATVLTVSNPRPDPLTADWEVDSREVRFNPPVDSRERPATALMSYPYFSMDASNELRNRSERVPATRNIFQGRTGRLFNPTGQPAQPQLIEDFCHGLRQIHAEHSALLEYVELRKQTQK